MSQVDFGIKVHSVSDAEMLIAPVLMRHDGQLLVLVRADEDEEGVDLRLRTPVPIEKFMAANKVKIVSFFPTPVNKNLRTVVFQRESQDVHLEISMSENPQPWMVAAAQEIAEKLGTPMPPEQAHDLWKAVLQAERERAARMGDPFSFPVEDGEDDEDDDLTVQEFLDSLITGDAEAFMDRRTPPMARRAHVSGITGPSLKDFMSFMRTNGKAS